jgi:hypothetical protein
MQNTEVALSPETVSQYVTFTPTGMVVKEGITDKQSRGILTFLRGIDTAMEFYIGDWIAQHKKSFGVDSCNEALQQEEFDFVRAVRAERLSSIPAEIRNPKLSVNHHAAIVGKTKDPEAIQSWLVEAEKQNLSPMELSRSVRAGHVITKAGIAKSCPSKVGFYTIHAIRMDFDRWLRQRDPEDWNDLDREEFLKMARPIYDLFVSQTAIAAG